MALQGVPAESPLKLCVACLQQQRGARAAAGQGAVARAPSPRRDVGGSRPGSPGRGAGPMLSPRERAFSPKRADGEQWAALHWVRRLQAGINQDWTAAWCGEAGVYMVPILLPCAPSIAQFLGRQPPPGDVCLLSQPALRQQRIPCNMACNGLPQ